MYPSVDTNQLVAHGCSALRFDVLECLKGKSTGKPPKKQEGGILYITCSIKTSPGSLNLVPQFCF